jgi:hypothetical protein
MKRIIMLSTLAIALGVTVILVGTTTTLAKPTPIEGSAFTVRGFCDFPVLFEAPDAKLNVIELPGGVTMLHAPTANYTLTNLEEPDNQLKVATFTSVTETPLPNGETLLETNGHIFFFEGEPIKEFHLFFGKTTLVVHQNGQFELLSTEGQEIDLCTKLA